MPAAGYLACSSTRSVRASTTNSSILQAAADKMNLKLEVQKAAMDNEIDSAFDAFVRQHVDGCWSPPIRSSTTIVPSGCLAAKAKFRRSINGASSHWRRFDGLRAEHNGGLSPGGNLHRPHPRGRQARGPSCRGARGVSTRHKPASRQQLGLTISAHMLTIADEVIESPVSLSPIMFSRAGAVGSIWLHVHCGTVIDSSNGRSDRRNRSRGRRPIVELGVVKAPRRAAVDDLSLFDACEYRVEFRVADVNA